MFTECNNLGFVPVQKGCLWRIEVKFAYCALNLFKFFICYRGVFPFMIYYTYFVCLASLE